MTLEEREVELNELFERGVITQREWALLWQQALDEAELYPEWWETE